MPSFTEGCVVRYRPTQSLYRVVRSDEDAAILLLTPAAHPSDASQSTASKERPRTRWVFEKMVDVVATSKAPTSGVATKSAAADAGTAAAAAAPTKNSAKPSTLDPTAYARRSAKLDRRVEFRRLPKRGRGLFALRDIPAGTEVMRVRAAGAVVSGNAAKDWCAGCFLSSKAVGRLDSCHGCPLRFCARCKRSLGASRSGGGGGAGHNRGMCELTKEILSMCSTNPGGSGSPNEGLVRLVADLFVRRKAGLLSDEEWDLVMSLESHDNEAGAIGLSPSGLKRCARLLKSLVGIDVSHEDLHAMYSRVTRNIHAVSPNITPLNVGWASSIGSVEGLFSFGALVNHSCQPNSYFHCVAKDPPSVNGPAVIEQVLRTIDKVQAGEELCYSYLSDSVARSVSERRAALEGWGFRCACARCQREVEEEIRLQTHLSPLDQVALQMLGRLEEVMQQGQRNAKAPKEEEIPPDLEEIARFMAVHQEGLSPCLATKIAVDLHAVTMFVDISDPLWQFAVCGFAAIAFSSTGSASAEISVRLQQYVSSTRIDGRDGLVRPESMEHTKAVGMESLKKAARLHGLLYGEEHEQNIMLRNRVSEAVRRSR